ncbi:MAG TPA: MarR family transcriptional regulator [Desulfobacteraceae bacterium]|nr:MarR family transcriptional regulator [Deltaproteobacteria bacterium]RLB97563.1 MAG: MarR family transcriptional regulator [Deltaproteobacteria bacterium]HDI58747.1 MarR family transcriptional regulator [Desulfobacteraceae bacterium]
MRAEDCIFFQLGRANRAGTRFLNRRVADLGITAVQAMALFFLAEADDVTSVHLGKRLQLDSATLTGLLDRLTAAGLAGRRADPSDRRAVRILLTEAGRAKVKRIKTLVADASREFLAALTPEERLILKSLLKKIR